MPIPAQVRRVRSPMRLLRSVLCVFGVIVPLGLGLLVSPAAAAAAWRVQPAPAQPDPNGQLSAVSCASRTACVAVGWFTDTALEQVTLAEVWNGKRWRNRNAMNPRVKVAGQLSAVSCVSFRACVAVGFGATFRALAERWNGKAWSVLARPTVAEPRGVSCATATWCVAVGTGATRWDGRRWAVQRVPVPGGGPAYLSDVSCRSSSACVAVGAYPSGHAQIPLVERWDGRTWSSQRIPLSSLESGPGVDGSITGVSCASARFCLAVGSVSFERSSDQYVTQPFAERWNGSRWSIQHIQLETSVSCASRVTCVAVGGANASIWGGKRWTSSIVGVSALSGVSCTGVRICMAVGDGTVAARWNGSVWSTRPARQEIGAFSSGLDGVACASAVACVAVGSTSGSTGNGPLAELWNGVVWSIRATPSPVGATMGQLDAVSCPSPRDCVAVGGFTNSVLGSIGNLSMPLAEVWDGATWSLQRMPSPDGASGSWLNGVSCTSATACTAVGFGYYPPPPNGSLAGPLLYQPLVERWNGSSWSIQATPATPGQLTGVSCGSPTDCIAVGYSDMGGYVPVVGTWNGDSWSFQNLPGSGNLNAVSCVSPTACTAVGFRLATPAALVERWNGSAWSAQGVPNARYSGADDFNGVSCASATACTAIGITGIAEVGTGPLAAVWEGTTWARQVTPNRPEGILRAIACTSSTTCTAVGQLVTSTPTNVGLPLLEKYS